MGCQSESAPWRLCVSQMNEPPTTPERPRLDVDIVCVGFGPATAEWFARVNLRLGAFA
jgi:hypothetical protein